MKAVFLDRDGTLVVGVPKYPRIDSVDKLELVPTLLEALSELSKLDYGVFIITNQAGIAEGLISEQEFENIHSVLLKMIEPSGIKIIKTYHCPHDEGSTCECRKPKPKMLLDAAKEFNIDLQKSWMVGDRPTDVETGINAGTKTILVQSGAFRGIAEDVMYTAPTLLDAVLFIKSN